MGIECFMVEPSATKTVTLRRYAAEVRSESCPNGYHNANRTVVDSELWDGDPDFLGWGGPPRDFPITDVRWPEKCDACDYEFDPEDHWQENHERHWIAADGRVFGNRKLPPGAMYWADWSGYEGPDGRCLAVALPPNGGDDIWLIDGPASNSDTPWTRTGTPPNVTARPSIATSRYHGFLTDGVLEPC